MYACEFSFIVTIILMFYCSNNTNFECIILAPQKYRSRSVTANDSHIFVILLSCVLV